MIPYSIFPIFAMYLCYSEPDFLGVRKFIVFEDCLLTPLCVCNSCGNTNHLRLKRHCLKTFQLSTFYCLLQFCFKGALPNPSYTAIHSKGMCFHSTYTYFRHQTDYLYPSMVSVWNKNHKGLLQHVR